jgi:hypothetical protein
MWFATYAWVCGRRSAVPTGGDAAMGLVLSIIVGCGLMALVF